MLNDILITAVVVLVAALVYAIRKIQTERDIKNQLYRQAITLPKAALMVSPVVSRGDSPEYKLEQALRREARLQEKCDRLENENLCARVQHGVTYRQYQELLREYHSQFLDGVQVVDGMVALMTENQRLQGRLTEETSARQLAELKLQRYESKSAADPCHATH